jgi:quercetin dioxygenase-like cupin family protein
MAHVGQTIEEPLSGERLTFLETAGTTGGARLKIRLEMAPGGNLAKAHVHPRATEEFEVLNGRIEIKTSGKTRIADAGETIVIPRGADHVWGNPFDDPATVAIVLAPALRMETFFENTFGLVRDGKCDPKTQMPSLLQMLLILHDYREDISLPGFAGLAGRGLGAVLAPLARARGYRSCYPQYSAPDAL